MICLLLTTERGSGGGRGTGQIIFVFYVNRLKCEYCSSAVLDQLSIDVLHPRGLHDDLDDHVADEDHEGDGEGDHKGLVDQVGGDKGGLDLGRPLLLGTGHRLLLAVQQRVDLLTIVDFL